SIPPTRRSSASAPWTCPCRSRRCSKTSPCPPRRWSSRRRRRSAGRSEGLPAMPTNIIMPALELAQETGKVLRWLKSPGDTVQKGEPIVEIETDKVTVEIEAPAAGVLRDVSAQAGDVVPVGRTIATVFAAGEAGAGASPPAVM